MKRFFVCMLVATTPTLAESLADFPFSADVPVKGGEGLHRVEVPFEVHRAARVDLGDPRVFNAKGEALPFAFAGSPAAAEPTREVAALPLFPLGALKVESSHAAPAPEVHLVTVGAQKGQRPGEYTYDLQAAVPVTRVQLLLSEPNVVAPVQIFSRNGDGAWREVGSATFYRLTRGGAEVRSKPIDVAPAPARYWMVRIDPKAGVPSEAPRLEAGYRSRQVVFASRGDGPYLLAFGNDQARPANLPLSTLIPGYERDAEYKLPAAQVGMTGYHDKPKGFSLDRKTLLWAVLVGGVLILGFMAWKLSKSGPES